jgi:hypothetical protein
MLLAQSFQIPRHELQIGALTHRQYVMDGWPVAHSANDASWMIAQVPLADGWPPGASVMTFCLSPGRQF